MVAMPHWPVPYGTKDIRLGLSRVRELLARIGDPHLKLQNVIHVAGTNGKGSTIANLNAILTDAGYSVNTYTSPHIYRFNERIVLAGREIEDDELFKLCERVRLAAADMQTTFYEATTAVAFLAMSRAQNSQLNINLIEVGLGGRLDATNVLESKLCSIITTIDYDHMEYLGTTLAQIALEKAAILRANSHGVIGWQYSESYDAIANFAKSNNVPIFDCKKAWDFKINDDGSWHYTDARNDLVLPAPRLLGRHQYINSATSIAAIKTLPQLNVTDQNIINGLQLVQWPARMEKITKGVLFDIMPEGSELWVDGAHNNGGAKMAALHLATLPNMPTILINGRTLNRDISGFLQCFEGVVDKVYAVPVYSEPKCENPEKILKIAKKIGFDAKSANSVTAAVKDIAYTFKNCRIMVCGSLYLAADMLQANKFDGE